METLMDSMTPTTWLAIAVGVVVLLVVVWMIAQRQVRSKGLRSRFGPEYDRLIAEKGSARRAERELGERQRRVEHLPIKPLPRDVSTRYAQKWNEQQARFVEEPQAAVVEADHLVEEVMRERGYPVGDFEQRAADISVDHPRVVENYRAAHAIATREQSGQASTEDLRAAMLYYRDLFRELLEEPGPPPAPAR